MGDKLYISPEKLLPLERFFPQSKGAGGGKGKGMGKGMGEGFGKGKDSGKGKGKGFGKGKDSGKGKGEGFGKGKDSGKGKGERPFEAQVKRAGNDGHLGYFATAEEAALAVARGTSDTVASRQKATKRAAPTPKPPPTKQARQATAGAASEDDSDSDDSEDSEDDELAADSSSSYDEDDSEDDEPATKSDESDSDEDSEDSEESSPSQAVPRPVGVAPAAVPTPAAPPAEGLLQKLGRVKTELKLDPGLLLVDAIKAANELMEITPAAGAGLPSQVDALLASVFGFD